MELLDIYDRNKEKTGRMIVRDTNVTLKQGEYFLYVKCLIINSKYEILLTKRRMDKRNGGLWEATGGCVISGENSIQAIIREIKEEIGLDVKENELILQRTLFQERKYKGYIRDIYVLYKDIDIKDLKFVDGDVIDAKFVSENELKQMIDEGKMNSSSDDIITDFKNIIDKKRGN